MEKLNEGHLVESYKYWDIVTLWGRERLEHDVTIARELAKGIIKNGLRFHSYDPKYMEPAEEFRSYPYIGYSAYQEALPIIIRAKVLEHLLAVMHENKDPSKNIINEEFVSKNDFREWLVKTGHSLPKFWYSENERATKA